MTRRATRSAVDPHSTRTARGRGAMPSTTTSIPSSEIAWAITRSARPRRQMRCRASICTAHDSVTRRSVSVARCRTAATYAHACREETCCASSASPDAVHAATANNSACAVAASSDATATASDATPSSGEFGSIATNTRRSSAPRTPRIQTALVPAHSRRRSARLSGSGSTKAWSRTQASSDACLPWPDRTL